jgi:hypothetical protein
MNDQSIKKLLCKSYPKSTFSRLKKSPRCGFIGVPENLASSNDTFQAAQTSNEGIPFKLPSLPPIYLRPKRKKVKKRSQKTHPQPHLQQQVFVRPAWNKTNHNQTHPTNITQEDRISTLETQVVSIKSQIQNLTHTNSNLKNQINEVQNKVESMAINIEEKFGAIQNSHSDTNSEIKSLAKNMNLISESIDTLIQASKSNHVSNPPTIPNQNLAPNSLTRKLSFSPLSHNVPIPQSLPTVWRQKKPAKVNECSSVANYRTAMIFFLQNRQHS